MTARALIVVVILLGAAAARQVTLAARPERTPTSTLRQFPLEFAGWRSTGDMPFSREIESILGVDEYVNRTYRGSDGVAVGLYVGYYRVQRQGSSIHSPLNCLPGSGWQPMSFERMAIGTRADAIVNRIVVQKAETRQVVYYWYQTHGRIVASEYWSKFYLVADSITSRRSDAALVRLALPMSDAVDARSVETRARDFAVETAGIVDAILFK